MTPQVINYELFQILTKFEFATKSIDLSNQEGLDKLEEIKPELEELRNSAIDEFNKIAEEIDHPGFNLEQRELIGKEFNYLADRFNRLVKQYLT